MDRRAVITEFLKERSLMVLSTISAEGTPQSAAVEYAMMDDGTIIFDTFNTSRKYHNLRTNPLVSCVIVDGHQTVQLEGEARELTEPELTAAKSAYFANVPRGDKFDARPETRYFCIVPRWVRYSDFGKNPWETFELNPADSVVKS